MSLPSEGNCISGYKTAGMLYTLLALYAIPLPLFNESILAAKLHSQTQQMT